MSGCLFCCNGLNEERLQRHRGKSSGWRVACGATAKGMSRLRTPPLPSLIGGLVGVVGGRQARRTERAASPALRGTTGGKSRHIQRVSGRCSGRGSGECPLLTEQKSRPAKGVEGLMGGQSGSATDCFTAPPLASPYRRSSPWFCHMLSMIRMICSVSMSCRRSRDNGEGNGAKTKTRIILGEGLKCGQGGETAPSLLCP